jgi:hypothetical protein
MGAYTLTKDVEGTVIANNGTLDTIHFTKAPVEPGGWFTLVDDSTGDDVTLYNIQTASMPFPTNTDIMVNGGIPFINLTLRSISSDSQFDITCNGETPFTLSKE